MKIIDPHVHLFNRQLGQYHWLKTENAPYWPEKSIIQRNFSEQDIHLPAPLSLSGFVHIEAGFNNEQPWQEIQWLESHCQQPFKSIAFADITQPTPLFHQTINTLNTYASVVGIRCIFDDALTKEAQQNLSDNLVILENKHLIFEVQLANNRKLITQFIALLKQHPSLTCIINHALFPHAYHEKSQWLNNISAFALNDNTYIKCSGWEMHNRSYTFKQVSEYIENCLSVFSVNKVLLASNFPLTLFSLSYQQYWQQLHRALVDNTQLSSETLHALFFQNAFKIYNF